MSGPSTCATVVETAASVSHNYSNLGNNLDNVQAAVPRGVDHASPTALP